MSHFPILLARKESDLSSGQWLEFSLKESMPHYQRLEYSLLLLGLNEEVEQEKVFSQWREKLSPYVLADNLVAHLQKQGCHIPGAEVKAIGLHGIDWSEWLAWRSRPKYSIAEIQSRLYRGGDAIHAIALPEPCLAGAKLIQKCLGDHSTVWDFFNAVVSLESSRLSSLAIRVRT